MVRWIAVGVSQLVATTPGVGQLVLLAALIAAARLAWRLSDDD